MRYRIFLVVAILLCSIAWGQSSTPPSSGSPSNSQPSMPGMDMSGMHHDMAGMKDAPADKDEGEAGEHVMHSMEGHMDMGPHMKMTALRPARPGDAERAKQVADAARKASEKYLDYHVALNDGFKIFHPEIPQKMYHFTNYGYAMEAAFRFNPEHPTSLLYEKHGDDYKLIGVMYTAPKRLTEDQLDERIPLSVAQWHEHVNFCVAPSSMTPAEKKEAYLGKNAKFGLRGSIDNQAACDVAGGRFLPIIFNWMVHVYPFEKDQASVWSAERQHGDAD
ncbi:MAG TPA: hypothetical protein VMH04_03100 [Candidatus Solibacter sp.]|nr:hypothetical protein [Candidatus Solibacter sp.]